MDPILLEAGDKLVREGVRNAPRMPYMRYNLFGFLPMFLVWNVLIIVVVALIFWWLTKGGAKKETAKDILDRRYAQGEIDRKTYKQMIKDLKDDLKEVKDIEEG